jgi:hypothetical protein
VLFADMRGQGAEFFCAEDRAFDMPGRQAELLLMSSLNRCWRPCSKAGVPYRRIPQAGSRIALDPKVPARGPCIQRIVERQCVFSIPVMAGRSTSNARRGDLCFHFRAKLEPSANPFGKEASQPPPDDLSLALVPPRSPTGAFVLSMIKMWWHSRSPDLRQTSAPRRRLNCENGLCSPKQYYGEDLSRGATTQPMKNRQLSSNPLYLSKAKRSEFALKAIV